MYKTPTKEKYLNDSAFRNIVDILRTELERWYYTPSELREAVILACTMHESTHLRPLWAFIDEAKDIPPAMFGGDWADSNTLSRTVSGSQHWELKTPEHFYLLPRGRDYSICTHCDLSDVYVNAFNVPCKP
jgi:hypothetical protein